MKLRIGILICCLSLWGHFAHAASPVVNDSDSKTEEMLESYAMKNMPKDYRLAHPLIKTSWKGHKSVIALYGLYEPKIYGHLYYKRDDGSLADIHFGSIDEDGGLPEILSVFFANADKDAEKELVVLTTIYQNHYGNYTGASYDTYIYDDKEKNGELPSLNFHNVFYGCDCNFYGPEKDQKARYKNEKSIKAKLAKMGFVQ